MATTAAPAITVRNTDPNTVGPSSSSLSYSLSSRWLLSLLPPGVPRERAPGLTGERGAILSSCLSHALQNACAGNYNYVWQQQKTSYEIPLPSPAHTTVSRRDERPS